MARTRTDLTTDTGTLRPLDSMDVARMKIREAARQMEEAGQRFELPLFKTPAGVYPERDAFSAVAESLRELANSI